MTTIALPDGRLLDVAVSGPAGGRVLVFHHGTPGSVSQFRSLQRAARGLGWRLATFSRPGYGGSTRRPGRCVADVAADVAALLDHLEADRCVVSGWSGGGPHALATAVRLAHRVDAALVIAGVGPYDASDLDFLADMGQQNIDEFSAARQGEAELQHHLAPDLEHLRQTDAAGIVTGLQTLLPEVDRAVLTHEFGADMAANFAEALRTGPDGWVDDDLAFVRSWGFELADVNVPVSLWQGSEDLMVPFSHGRWLAANIPGVTAHLLEGEGHLSISVGALDAMLAEVASLADAGR